MKRNPHFVHFFVVNIIRLILVVTFFYAFSAERVLVQTVCVIGFFVTFLPFVFKKFFGVKLPVSFEILYLMVIYGLFIFGEIRGFYSGLWWWRILTKFTASIVLGLISLSIVFVLYKPLNMRRNFVFAGIMIFCFTVTLGIIWEVFEFLLDLIIHTGLQKSLFDTMQGIVVNLLGAVIVSIVGAFNIKRGHDFFVSTFFSSLIEEGVDRVFGRRRDSKFLVLNLIKEGESELVEFKSSMRVNLHTGEFDKRMEQGILKTISAFLNTKGGNLLIGVDDKGEILGLDGDSFGSDDKIGLHLTNLIKTHIGNEFLPYIRFRILRIDGKSVVLVVCENSKRRVFLKWVGLEEFYIRNGPASIRLEGSSLVNYIEHKFGRAR